jgi:hypothetical protein
MLRFQLTPPRGERPLLECAALGLNPFQLTPPCAERPRPRCSGYCPQRFNSRATRGATSGAYHYVNGTWFQLTLPCGGATGRLMPTPGKRFVFQLTLPRRERRLDVLEERVVVVVSTHAPTGRATLIIAGDNRVRVVSTHAPAPGATRDPEDVCAPLHVSTHAPRGERPHRPGHEDVRAAVSTHAPARGATPRKPASSWAHAFQLTPRTGSDTTTRSSRYRTKWFQLTPPARGATGLPAHHRPRPRVSTHAPRGSDAAVIASSTARWFQLTLRRGGATTCSSWRRPAPCFNSPARGATWRRVLHRLLRRSQFTPRGERRLGVFAETNVFGFQLTPLAGSDPDD